KRCIDFCLHSGSAESICNINTVHHCGKHSNLVCLCSLHTFTGSTSPEVSPADHNGYLQSFFRQDPDLTCHIAAGCFIKPCFLVSCKCLSAKFQEDTLHILHIVHSITSFAFFYKITL